MTQSIQPIGNASPPDTLSVARVFTEMEQLMADEHFDGQLRDLEIEVA